MKFRAVKYRIYPTNLQKEYFAKEFGCNRFIYNYLLDLQNKKYATDKSKYTKFDLHLKITELVNTSEFSWLKEVNSQSIRCQSEHLEVAFTKFFKKQGGYPKFKSKKNNRCTFKIPQSVKLENNRLKIPKLKSTIKVVIDREIQGTIQNATITKTPTNKYFVSVTYKVNETIPELKPISENQAIGIDLGIKTFATLSNGITIENPKLLRKSLKKLKRLSKRHSKKQKDSKNKEKSRIKLALQYEKVSNQRNDFLHKVTTKLVNDYSTICLETLMVKNMMKNHKLALSISDLGIGYFNQMINYKAQLYGTNILRIGTFEPSSKMCSCGVINQELSLKDRIWTCKSCNVTHDRDLLASQNIKKFAFLKQTTVGFTEC